MLFTSHLMGNWVSLSRSIQLHTIHSQSKHENCDLKEIAEQFGNNLPQQEWGELANIFFPYWGNRNILCCHTYT